MKTLDRISHPIHTMPQGTLLQTGDSGSGVVRV
jgi:hypothetical protein